MDPSDSTPIWSQIEEGLRRLVASGALAPGAAVPSVRDLARELSVNPATVAKAYQRLAEAGVLSVRRGDGTYVADAPRAMGKPMRQKAMREGALALREPRGDARRDAEPSPPRSCRPPGNA